MQKKRRSAYNFLKETDGTPKIWANQNLNRTRLGFDIIDDLADRLQFFSV